MSEFKAASVIAAPVFDGRPDADATTEKICDFIREAADNNAEFIAFPEAYLPFYPWWVYMGINNVKQGELFRDLVKNSCTADSPQIQKIAQVCRQTGMVAMIGMDEKEGNTIYNSQLYIDRGKILGTHRKLVPTGGERAVWGRGDGSRVRVFDTSLGKIGGLICYEHSMVLARYALYAMGEQIHVSNFPGANFNSQPRDRNKVIDAIIRNVAFEGQVFVINSTTVLSKEECDFYLELDPQNKDILSPGGGIAAIVDPASNYIGGPLENEEGIIYGNIDLDKIMAAKHMIDGIGHYARPDIFTLIFNNKKQTSIEIATDMENNKCLTKESIKAIKVLKERLSCIDDDQVAASVEELCKLI